MRNAGCSAKPSSAGAPRAALPMRRRANALLIGCAAGLLALGWAVAPALGDDSDSAAADTSAADSLYEPVATPAATPAPAPTSTPSAAAAPLPALAPPPPPPPDATLMFPPRI